jgi:DNA-binding CsgD family transcriptional regulator
MVLEVLNTAAITLNAKNGIVGQNRRAQQLLADGSQLYVNRHKLSARGRNSSRFSLLLARVSKSGKPESMGLFSPEHFVTAYVTVSRLSNLSDVSASETAILLVQLNQIDDHPIATEEQLAQIFLFSNTEARLARATALGQTLEKFAAEYGVKMTTVRSQMASIYLKAHVRRQSDLVRLILAIPCVWEDVEKLEPAQSKIRLRA